MSVYEKIDALSKELESSDYPHFIFLTNNKTGISNNWISLRNQDIRNLLTVLVHEIPESIEIMNQVLNENNDILGPSFKFHNN